MSYLRNSSFDKSPSKRYIGLPADPSICILRSSNSIVGIAGDGPHIDGHRLVGPTSMRENEFQRTIGAVSADSSCSFTIVSFRPYGWMATFANARTANSTESVHGRARTVACVIANCGSSSRLAKRHNFEKKTAAKAPK